MKKKYFHLVATALFVLFLPLSLLAKVDYQVEDQPTVIEATASLDHQGVLKQKDNGYLYVEVPNEYISLLLPLIDCDGRLVPPRHYTSKKGIGAHISVMYENERIDNEIWNIDEMGEVFTFDVKELRTVKLTRDNKMKKLWLLALEAPELEKLREAYGLSNKLKGHDFHITLAYQLPTAQAKDADAVLELRLLDEEELETFLAEAA